jgi:hypothetical protein
MDTSAIDEAEPNAAAKLPKLTLSCSPQASSRRQRGCLGLGSPPALEAPVTTSFKGLLDPFPMPCDCQQRLMRRAPNSYIHIDVHIRPGAESMPTPSRCTPSFICVLVKVFGILCKASAIMGLDYVDARIGVHCGRIYAISYRAQTLNEWASLQPQVVAISAPPRWKHSRFKASLKLALHDFLPYNVEFTITASFEHEVYEILSDAPKQNEANAVCPIDGEQILPPSFGQIKEVRRKTVGSAPPPDCEQGAVDDACHPLHGHAAVGAATGGGVFKNDGRPDTDNAVTRMVDDTSVVDDTCAPVRVATSRVDPPHHARANDLLRAKLNREARAPAAGRQVRAGSAHFEHTELTPPDDAPRDAFGKPAVRVSTRCCWRFRVAAVGCRSRRAC